MSDKEKEYYPKPNQLRPKKNKNGVAEEEIQEDDVLSD